MPRLVTLLTDFGTQDVYVGVMKAVIADISPETRVIDLTHDIAPQDIAAGRFNLMSAYGFCPEGAVHVAVVDPGVGGQRRAIAIELEDGFLVGPDNGLFSGVLSQHRAVAAVELTERRYWRSPSPSATFHGRDIFAPVGAHLSRGVALAALGQPISLDSLITLELPTAKHVGDAIAGSVQYIDRFGNLVTTIAASEVPNGAWHLQLGAHTISCGESYSAVEPGMAIALLASHGWVEVAVNGGSAQQLFDAQVGTLLEIRWL